MIRADFVGGDIIADAIVILPLCGSDICPSGK
jgi:hypothetical protein